MKFENSFQRCVINKLIPPFFPSLRTNAKQPYERDLLLIGIEAATRLLFQ